MQPETNWPMSFFLVMALEVATQRTTLREIAFTKLALHEFFGQALSISRPHKVEIMQNRRIFIMSTETC